MRAIESLIKEAVDYAGLFPPASLPMQAVVANYADYLIRDDRPMLGRLVVPASRLAEFETEAMRVVADHPAELPWRISALVPPTDESDENSDPFVESCQMLMGFNEAHRQVAKHRFIVDSIEVKTSSADHVEATIKRVPDCFHAFLEIDPSSTELAESVMRLGTVGSGTNVFAKIRSGNIKAELIPPTESVAGFIDLCARHGVGFKATAGLHHPFRNEYPLTYEANSPTAILNGFVNVFMAAILAFEYRVEQAVIMEVLTESNVAAFRFEDDEIVWKGFHVSSAKIANARRTGIISFGSCSFDEPSHELKAALNCPKLFVEA